ncbi:extracellular solute-binding protein [Cohnella sp. CFH 77786]|uniref:extracellular solute-binding protein n=1 Tax=Cohnella sp. CFH 77786 TaxID=2662265 RepID=UPI001C60A6D0|nr:extracellular solute-binding protein [Cohnella sp. CFH 77786]
MQAKKKGSILMVVLAAMLILSACNKSGSDESSASPSASASGSGGGSGEKVQFSYLLAGKYINWLKDLKWYPELLKNTNADIELVNGGEDDDQYYKSLETKLMSNDLPDSAIVTLSQAEVYGSQGLFLNLKDLIEKNAPNIKKFIDANPDYKKMITASDGNIYGLPQQYPVITPVPFYRADFFERAGIASNPTTIQEFTDVLKKLKAAYPAADFYPFTGRDGYIKFTESFQAKDFIDDSGKVHGIYNNGLGYDLKAPGFKQLVEWYNTLFTEKLIDPEWIYGTQTEETWQTKMLTGKGAISYDFFTRPSWFMNNGGPKNDPKYSIKVMDALKDQQGNAPKVSAYQPRFRNDRVFVINAASEKKAEAIIKFMDYVFSDEGRTLMDYGVEGQSYKNEGGEKEYLVKFEEEGNKPLGTPVWNFLQDRLTFPAPSNDEAYYQWMDDLTKSFAKDFFTKYAEVMPALKYSTDQLKERSGLVANVQPMIDSNLVKFITGKRPISEWDAFLKEADAQGYSKIVDIDQAAYDANK